MRLCSFHPLYRCFAHFAALFSGTPPLFAQADATDDFDTFFVPETTRLPNGKRMLLMVDDDNLRLSAARHRCLVDYEQLVMSLREKAVVSLDARAVLTSAPGDHRDANRLRAAGIHTLRLDRTYVPAVGGGTRVVGNDGDLIWEVSRWAVAQRYDTIVLATGDGDLALCVANGVARAMARTRIVTLSVAGSVSGRIRPNGVIHGCILLGRDLMLPGAVPPLRKPRDWAWSSARPTQGGADRARRGSSGCPQNALTGYRKMVKNRVE